MLAQCLLLPWHARAHSSDVAISQRAMDGEWSSKEAEAAQLRQKRMADAATADAREAQDKISDLQVFVWQRLGAFSSHPFPGARPLVRFNRTSSVL